ncbi:MAG TPA: DUF4037 domain-containing protein [Lachnospiraceae bacterium]|nr:DUF4037 domain-containing protein [Lachnospiraceae bacterium]
MKAIEIRDKLVLDLSQLQEVKGIGQTGDINAKLIPGQSDIDLFVLCTSVPKEDVRKQIYSRYSTDYTGCQMNASNGGIWGYGDILFIEGIDVMFMYFTFDEMRDYIEEVLRGDHLGKEGDFYPTGRLSSIENINILYEDSATWSSLKERAKTYPHELFERLFKYHINSVLDEEDLGRVLLRKEVMFYHQVLEHALDHLLQALFALNNTYFPSRKRSEQYIESFMLKPTDCNERILRIIKDSVEPNSMAESVKELRSITGEIERLVTR